MFAEPPVCNLLVIRSTDIERAVRFYESLGMVFGRERHGAGPEHYASAMGGFVFEIYPRRSEADSTLATRIGFHVDDVDGLVETVRREGLEVVRGPFDREDGRVAVLKDFDGHTVEIVTPAGREADGV